MTVQSPLLTAAESMAYLRKSRAWLTRHADEIGCVRDGGRLYFRLTRLDAWIARHEVVPVGAPTAMAVERRVSGRAGIGRINPFTGEPYKTYGPIARDVRGNTKKARASR